MAVGHEVMMSTNNTLNCDEFSQSEFSNQLILNHKGKLKWNGSFENLQKFLWEFFSLKGKWTCPGGQTKELVNDEITIRYNSNTSSLIIAGTKGEDLKQKLNLFARSESNESLSNNNTGNIVCDEINYSFEDSDETCLTNGFSNLASPTFTSVIEITPKRCNQNLAEQIKTLEAKFDDKFKTLEKDVNSLINADVIRTSLSIEYVERLKRENLSLHDENKSLKERVNNLSFVASDLNTKVNILEQDKSSLMTALKILQEEENIIRKANVQSWRTATKSNNTNMNTTGNGEIHSSLNLHNKYEVLSVDNSNSEDVNIAVHSESNVDNSTTSKSYNVKHNDKRGKSNNNRQYNKEASRPANNQQSTTAVDLNVNRNVDQSALNSNEASKSNNRLPSSKFAKKKTVVIAGDSIVKNVIGAKMSSGDHNHFYIVKSFSGATLADMNDFVKPLTRRKPDKLIMHVGTNDLKHSPPRHIAESIVNLVTNINDESPETKVGISTLLIRNDDNNISVKVNQVNSILKDICNQRKIPLLVNTNITSTHLNSKGLHLNRQGSATLQRNFKDFANDFFN